jgi:hypothetical protein
VPRDIYAFSILAACTIIWLLIMLPTIVFLFSWWKWRRDDMTAMMSPKVLRLYYAQFFPSLSIADKDLTAYFSRDFTSRYGRRLYIVPLTLLGLIAAAGLISVGGTLMAWVGVVPASAKPFSLDPIAFAALGGGFTWVVSDELGRFRTRDFTTYDVFNSVFRVLVAIPLGYSFAAFLESAFKIPVAYLLGAFPTSALFTIARRLGGQKLGLSDDASDSGPELEQLPDVGRAFAERLKDEGINSITELAYADPVNLTLRTNKPFTYITDCISQALLWMYISTGLPKVQVLGLRGAQEAYSLLDDLKSTDAAEQTDAQQALSAAATILGVTPEALRHTLEEVALDPYTEFLVQIWSPVGQVSDLPSSPPR